MYTHILLPTDGSELSKKAVDHGIALAKAINADVTALVVSTPFQSLVVDPGIASAALDQYKKLVADHAARYLAAIQESATALDVGCELLCVEHSQPSEAIVDTAIKNGCDLIVMASHGLSGISANMLGSETLKVLTRTTVPVLVYR